MLSVWIRDVLHQLLLRAVLIYKTCIERIRPGPSEGHNNKNVYSKPAADSKQD